MLSLLEGESGILNETNDQLAPLMKQLSIFNFKEELKRSLECVNSIFLPRNRLHRDRMMLKNALSWEPTEQRN